ncbi:MAG: helix-turn-helix transcriptional regulator [Cryomorphaceae bacterium]|nr:helix-turn-helix transcriptional regulator [Cryomorphaceae bacterium]
MQARKEKGFSREELAAKIGTSDPIVGRFERGNMMPLVEIGAKIAEALEVSLDFLVGKSSQITKDKNMLRRLEDIVKLPDADRQNIFYTLDGLIKAAKLKTIQ